MASRSECVVDAAHGGREGARLLACLHTCCAECIGALPRDGDVVRCPCCGQRTVAAQALATPDVVGARMARLAAAARSHVAAPDRPRCDHDDGEDATHLCPACDMWMCAEHAFGHARVKVFATHTGVVALGDVDASNAQTVIACPTHEGSPLQFMTTDGRALCARCIVHGQHHDSPLADVARAGHGSCVVACQSLADACMPGHMHGHTCALAEARTSIAALLAQCDYEDRVAQLTRAGSALRAQRLQLEALIDKDSPAHAESARTSSDAADGVGAQTTVTNLRERELDVGLALACLNQARPACLLRAVSTLTADRALPTLTADCPPSQAVAYARAVVAGTDAEVAVVGCVVRTQLATVLANTPRERYSCLNSLVPCQK